MADKPNSFTNDIMMQSISIDPSALLTTSTINRLHFPDLTTSGISDSGGGRTTSLNLEGVGMCESMTESFCSVAGQDESLLVNTNGLQLDTPITPTLKSLGKKESINAQKKRRSRKAQYETSVDGFSLDRIESVNLNDELNDTDDTWLFKAPTNGNSNIDNIYSWVHKEFKENDINATKHRLLCKLDDMSHARTIRSISCHNFPAHERSDSVKRSSTEQQVNPEATINGRMVSPLRSSTPHFYEKNGNTRPTSPASSSPLRHTIAATSVSVNRANSIVRSRDASKERDRQPLDYTDLEVIAKVQLENLRQAERQGPLSRRFGGSNVSLASTSSATSLTVPNGNKPPVVPKSSVVARNGVKPNNHRRSNTQTISTNVVDGYDLPDATEPKPVTPRANALTPNSANTNRTRPPVTRPLQAYRGSQTSYNNATPPKVQPTTVQKPVKKPVNDFNSTFTAKQFASNENGLLNDVSNKPLTTPTRTQVGLQRRTPTQSSVEQIPPSPSSGDMTPSAQTSIPRSASSLSQGRKSGIPTIGKQQRPSIPTATRPTTTATANTIPSSQSSDSMMVTRNIQTKQAITRPQIPDNLSPTSSWNEGCY